MRLWSIHPRYLDSQGLVALWREGLLAQKVLAGKTKGYKHHPQLARFQKTKDPLASIGSYLHHIVQEAIQREYKFDQTKILKLPKKPALMKVTRGQVHYEFQHLLRKLQIRQPPLFAKWKDQKKIQTHPLFHSVAGKLEEWEKTHS